MNMTETLQDTLNFDEITQIIHKGSVVTFREYSLDRHERKHLSVSIEDGVVQAVIPAKEKLSRDALEQYYGTELDEVDYLQLSEMNCPRIVVSLGFNQNNQLDIKVIILNKDFYNVGMQELLVTNEFNPCEEPSYLQAQKGW